MKVHINKDLLPMKGHYFLFNAGVAPVQPFMPVIAKDLNFPSNAVGIINGILPFTGMLAKPFFGAIADRFRLHKFIFILFQVITILGFFSLSFLTRIEDDSGGKVRLVCGAETNIHIVATDVHKRCLLDDIIKNSSNRTVKCALRCDLSTELRRELCDQWKSNPSVCAQDILPDARYADAHKEIVEVTNSTDADKYVSIIDGVKLEFIATIPLVHTLKIGTTGFFRVTDAELNDGTHHIPYCKSETHTNCEIHCNDSQMSDLVRSTEKEEHANNFVEYYQFWAYLFLAILSWVGMAVVSSVADAVCFGMLGENGNRYGRQRLWGSVGWGLFAIISGLLVDAFSTGGRTNYMPAFYIMFIVILCDVACSCTLKYEQAKVSTNIFKNIGRLLKDFWVIFFIVWCIIVGMCVGVQWTFLFWYLETLTESCDYESNKKIILGLVSGVQCFLGELPSFFLFEWIIKKLGPLNVMSLIPFLIGSRFILYSVLTNPWWALPIEVLQFSVGLTFASMASYVSAIASPGTEATMQGLVGAIFEGIGVSLGSYFGGLIFDGYDGSKLFQIFAIIAYALCFTHWSIHCLLGKNFRLNDAEKGFKGVAKYAIPNEAVSMLEDT